ncbi:MAG: hypothetical protein JWR26_2295 [Pedosphaera sp.]|nr:hypothetical protein [Pedosphaera sp.]
MAMKPYSNSIVHGLPAEQRERVDLWLFEENVSYAEVAHRCQQLLNVKVSSAAVQRYYRRACVQRRLEGAAGLGCERKKLAATLEKHAEKEFSIAVGLASQLAADEAIKPENHADVKRLNEVMRMTIAARREENERKRIALQAERTAQHGRKVALLEKRFQFSASVECLKHAREMEIIMKKEWDDGDRVMEIRERLFGPNLPE